MPAFLKDNKGYLKGLFSKCHGPAGVGKFVAGGLGGQIAYNQIDFPCVLNMASGLKARISASINRKLGEETRSGL